MKNKKIIITGAAGTVGQNLVDVLSNKNYEIVAIDKHRYNLNLIKERQPGIKCILADVSEPGKWEESLNGAYCLVSLQAQISAKERGPFVKNSVIATEIVCKACKKAKIKYIIHASSSVVISIAKDDYTDTKRKSEEIVKNSGIDYAILRPTLMFGLYDKKHLGYLSRFMEKVPVYPIPGSGKITRQPLYVTDFCKIIERCIQRKPKNIVYNVIGKEKIYYVDIIKTIKKIKGLHTLIIHIPIWLFRILLDTYAIFSKNPPFTSDQLKALINDDIFPVSPWWKKFNIKPTPFFQAMKETHTHPNRKIVPMP